MHRLIEFDYFRGATICIIVFGHAVLYTEGPDVPLLLENTLQGGSGLFVFISGFFLHAVYSERFHYIDFVLKKARNVALPCLIFSIFVVSLKMAVWIFYFGHSFEVASDMMLAQAARGYVLATYWYIPFIMLVFLISPLHMRFLEMKLSHQALLVSASLVTASLLHRSIDNENVIQNVVYYTPFYLLGIMYSQKRSWLITNSRSVLLVTGSLFLLLLSLQTYVFVHAGNYYKPPLEYGGIDLMLLQKFVLCVLLAESFRLVAQRHELAVLSRLAVASFAIYFLHGIILEFYKILWAEFANVRGFEAVSIGSASVGFMLALVGSYFVARVLKNLFGKRSKMVIGW